MSIVLWLFWKYFYAGVVCSLKFWLHVAGEKQPPLTGIKCLVPWIWILIGLLGKAENTQAQRKPRAICDSLFCSFLYTKSSGIKPQLSKYPAGGFCEIWLEKWLEQFYKGLLAKGSCNLLITSLGWTWRKSLTVNYIGNLYVIVNAIDNPLGHLASLSSTEEPSHTTF